MSIKIRGEEFGVYAIKANGKLGRKVGSGNTPQSAEKAASAKSGVHRQIVSKSGRSWTHHNN